MSDFTPKPPSETQGKSLDGGLEQIASSTVDGFDTIYASVSDPFVADEVDISIDGDGSLRFVNIDDVEGNTVESFSPSGQTFNSTFSDVDVGQVDVGYDATSDTITVSLRRVYLPQHKHQI